VYVWKRIQMLHSGRLRPYSGWKGLAGTNTLAYYEYLEITTVNVL